MRGTKYAASGYRFSPAALSVVRSERGRHRRDRTDCKSSGSGDQLRFTGYPFSLAEQQAEIIGLT
jgi:hypothetical protein